MARPAKGPLRAEDAEPSFRLEPRLPMSAAPIPDAAPATASAAPDAPRSDEAARSIGGDEELLAAFDDSERDWATIAGLGAGLLLILSAILLGGSLPAYADIPAFLMVFGGTAAVTLVSFSLEDAANLPRVLSTALWHRVPHPSDAALRLVALAERARAGGIFSLERELPKLVDDSFLVKAMALVIDNTPPDILERELRAELQAMFARHARTASLLRRGGEVAPAMGLIGTLVGLVQMLANLDNPSSIGPSMAVAILATLYGAALANMVLLPLAYKLERNTHDEALIHNLTILAATSIAVQESPRRTEVLLNSLLPPGDRIGYFD